MLNKELYILGLVISDGYYNKNNYCIELKDEDDNVLKQIANDFDSLLYYRTRDTNFAKNFSSTTIVLKDRQIKDILDKYVPKTNKTLDVDIPKEYFDSPSLWRGIIDGDGCYGYRNKTPYVGFVTVNENLKNAFINIVKKVTGQEIIATRNKRDGVYNIGLTSVRAKEFVEWLLKEESYGIERKTAIMESICQWQPTGRQGIISRRWTKDEEDYVFTHTNEECVKHLNRTLTAIQQRRTKINKERKLK